MSKKILEDAHDLTPIRFKDLSVILGQKIILDKINCKIKSNSITAVLGPNGAGKSIFLQTINGLISIQSGRLTFNSMEKNQEIRKQQALVFQNPVLLRRTVMANMQFVLNLRNRESNQLLKNILDKVGLEGYEKKSARLLSGGEKQRLSMARALVVNPHLLLLDEPTANLDPYSLNLIEDLVLEENSIGKTVIFTTHDMSQAKRLATDVIFLNKGKVLEQTVSKTFFKSPKTLEAQKYINGEILI
ncbi:MAG: ATP-binding cassette domain-containing protein [Alphaproteobacteria bacterium]|jgi:tungstate transport system ATP-binding protein|nr:ATP-binding cassette domain-containing protein [Alphaproteobacteria bacterium]MDG1467217.1 ATP-binding cassette domain-containing protein [Alphaproteobacteria bacterium]MDG1882293.1 ATP-binding cassette domain-containing protein [Alphaproteobacteria bacterium]MDG2458921.1 ATP-binding cassette domain-containing protein [Alphaproteobacteria bacterium]